MGICSSKGKEPLKLEPAPRDPIDRVAWKLHRAIHVDDVEQVVKQMVIKVPSLATPRGISRGRFVKEILTQKYEAMGYGDLLSDVLDCVPRGTLWDLMVALLSEKLDFQAQIMKRAMGGFGTDEAMLIAFLCTLDEEEIYAVQTAYAERYEESLERAVLSKTSGKFKRTLLLAGCDAAPECYAKVFHAAIKGVGTDCKAIVRLLVTLDHETIAKTRESYMRLFKKDLLRALSSEFKVSGDFKKIVVALATKHPSRIQETISDEQYEAEVNEMYDAVKGIGTDESKIIQLLCNKTPEQIEEFKFRYQMKYTEMLKDRLKVETTGIFENKYFRETIQGLLTNREEQIAVYLKEAFGGWLFSNDDWGLISMLVHRTPEQMKEIREQYMITYGNDLVRDIRKNCKGDYEESLVALVVEHERTVARALRAAIQSWGDKSKQGSLVALLTNRDEEMPTLRKAFMKEFNNTTLQGMIKKECSGLFEACLLSLAMYTEPKKGKAYDKNYGVDTSGPSGVTGGGFPAASGTSTTTRHQRSDSDASSSF